ncbi:ABC transporter ATP-binding protein [Orbaceae bacterium ESL0727]|nr:ABC transporter ATP-binding protein [Orbaceae bacterium ESL0727]
MIVFDSIQIRRGANLLLDNASATINPNQKVGLIGKNGCGKSTLFALIKGEIQTDAGTCTLPNHWQLAWVSQETPALDCPAIEYVIDGDREYRQLQTELNQANLDNNGHQIALLHEKLDNIDAWTIESRAATLLHGLGFSNEQLNLPVKSYSGGWRMRLNLAQALMCRSDLLLLDEPTNHLDLDAVIWLEKYLSNYSGTLLLISHDRDFLDPLVNKIIHIEQKQLFEYTGNYSSFELQRATKLSQQQSLYESQQLKVAHLQNYIDRFRAKATKAKQAQSRMKMLEKMELIAPAHIDSPFHFNFKPADFLPSPLLTMDKVVAGYDEKIVLEKIKLNLVPGSRIGLLGRNGAGKSTLIKLLAGELAPKEGHIQLAKGVQLGYFAQHQLEYLRPEESSLWHLTQIADAKITEQELRNYLGGFDFHGDKVLQPVNTFSGGEKARLVLALLVWQKPNLLLLDEPTNHLDLDMRQALTEALIDFEGAIVVVSHDRHLLRSTTDEFYLVHDHLVEPFSGDLEDYQKWLAEDQKKEGTKTDNPSLNGADHQVDNLNTTDETIQNLSAQERKEQKRKQAELRAQLQPLKKQLEKEEQKLNKLTAQLQIIETKLADASLYETNRKTELTDLLLKQSQLKNELDETELNWLTLQQQLEDFNTQ